MRRELAGLALGVVLLGGLVALLDPGEVFAAAARARIGPLVAGVALGVAGVGLLGGALYGLRRSLDAGGADAPGRFYVAFLRAYFVRLVMPVGSSGAPAIYALFLKRAFDSPFEEELAVSTAAELVSYGASAGLALAGVTMLTLGGEGFAYDWAVAAVVGAILLGVLVAFGLLWHAPDAIDRAVRAGTDAVDATLGRASERVHRRVAPERVDARLALFHETTALLGRAPRSMGLCAVVTVLAWVALSLPLLLAVDALGGSVPLALVLVAVPLGGFAYVLPVSGGLGGVEATLAGLLVVAGGMDVQVAAAAVLLHRLATFWTPLAVGGVAMAVGSRGTERLRPDPP